MTGSRLALVSDDQRLGQAIAGHLKCAVAPQLLQCNYREIRGHLGRETDGLLLLAVASAAEVEQVQRLLREIALQQLPPVVVVVEDKAASGDALAGLDAFVARFILWPNEAEVLDALIRERMTRTRAFHATREESVEEVIRHRLLTLTPSLMPMSDRIALASAHDVTVLLTGETGTGKTHLARLMHDCSPRKHAPFLTVPCGALPANLLESAFFGHVKGAFTGADRAKVGKFEAAGDGSILLDEIDTLGLEHQAGLLRVIETGEFEPVGGNETRRCNARIIVASNWDLEEAVQAGKFRQDLYYRLNVMSFHLPPLRERVQDIGPLVRGMAARFTTKFRKDLVSICPRAMEALEAFPWPGNIRQLENFVQQAVLVSSGPDLLFEHLPEQVRDYRPVIADSILAGVGIPADTLIHHRELLERNVIQRALLNNGYSRSRAANALGISRVTLYKKMKKYGLMRPPARPDRA
jgi:DNA-binding NtrC family response regulator